MRHIKYFLLSVLFLSTAFSKMFAQQDTIRVTNDSIPKTLPYPFTTQTGGLYLDVPVDVVATYDSEMGLYKIEQQVAGEDITPPVYMNEKEYANFLTQKKIRDYYLSKSRELDSYGRATKGGLKTDDNNLIPKLKVNSEVFKRIFGSDEISLTPNGYASFDIGIHQQQIEDPQIPLANRKQFDIDVQQRIQMSLLGKVGENLQLQANYDTQAGFAFENKLNFKFSPSLNNISGGEDNIIQNLEVGNVSFPLRSTLIQGSQSLFGAKADLKFGKTFISTVFSEQRSESKTIVAQNGGVLQDFSINAREYEINANFYLSAYHRNRYNQALRNYPTINTSSTISRIEVWVKNRTNSNINAKRSIIAMRDLGESGTIPQNGSLYTNVSSLPAIRDVFSANSALTAAGYQQGIDYVVEENMRLLNPSEYTFNPALGTLFLNQPVNEDEIVAVSYQLQSVGNSYQVGELSSDINAASNSSETGTSTLITKLIKGRGNDPVNNKPLWDLMMKNVYGLNTTSMSAENFQLDVYYNDPQLGLVNYLNNSSNESTRLLTIENLDHLNQAGNQQPNGDAQFDYVNGITVASQSGKIIFTTVEPFNATITNFQSPGTNEAVAYEDIYTKIQNTETGEASKYDKFLIKGQFSSSSSDVISLGAINVPEGSVQVTANGQELIEGQDYIIDYTLGTVKIINEQIKSSGVPVNINLEDQGLFSLTKQRFWGVNVEHRFNDNFYIGGTVINYSERSVTPKVNYGVEPVNNTMFGANIFYSKEAPFLTRWVNALPLIETTAPSNITFQGELAYLMPGQAKNTTSSYIDDFEDSKNNISIKDPFSWQLASVPGASNPLFNNGNTDNMEGDLAVNYNRGLASWYTIDPQFYIGSSLNKDQLSNNLSRQVRYKEIYPQQDFVEGSQSYISTFDLSYFPTEKGPYNNNPAIENPSDRWAGIMRGLNVTNFNETNIDYVEFWVMDPFADGNNTGDSGELILQLGSVSEDILKDGRKAYENGNPIDNSNDPTELTQVPYGYVPTSQALVYTFDSNGAGRTSQDRGLDGLLSSDEASVYTNNTTQINPVTGALDPAGDDYVNYLNANWSNVPTATNLVERYKYFKNPEGNSPDNANEFTTQFPDVEDVNKDFTMDQQEAYFEYRLPIDANFGTNEYVVDSRTVSAELENGQFTQTKWYQVRIPIDSYNKIGGSYGSPSFNNIRYMRMIAKGFTKNITFRFATLDLIRSNWRRYTNNLSTSAIEDQSTTVDVSNFKVGVISLEENADRYVLPPGISREEFFNTTNIQAQNEQSLLMQVEDLTASDRVRAIYKNTSLDLRRYKQLEMFIHAEDYLNQNIPSNNDLSVFIRFGTDATSNYYEYSKPLIVGPKASSALAPEQVWNPDNTISFNLHDFVETKIKRDQALQEGIVGVSFNNRYVYDKYDGNDDQLIVKGRPTLENVRYVVVGVRLNDQVSTTKNAEIWINELRLSEIDNEGGLAATGALDIQLADLASINTTGTYKEAGFGAINEGPSQRSQEDVKQYLINSTVNVDKVLPQNWGIKLPLGITFGEQFIDPLYSPIDTDVKFKEAPNSAELKEVARDYTRTQGFSLLNIRKDKINATAKNHFYDIENFSASVAYNKNYHRDFYIQEHTTRDLRLGLDYNYSFKPTYMQPFSKWRAVHDTASTAKYLQFAKEFNVNLKPSRVLFSAEINRQGDQFLYRDVSQYRVGVTSSTSSFTPTYSNNFYFNWRYQIGFDLTRSLKLDYQAATTNLLDEYSAQNTSIWNDLFNTGNPTSYTQQFRLNYEVPFTLVPFMEFVNANISYDAAYDWRRVSNSFVDIDQENLGNIIQNRNTFTFQAGLDLEQVWSKYKWYQQTQQNISEYKADVENNAYDYQSRIDKRNERIAKGKKTKKLHMESKKTKHNLSLKDYFYQFASSIKQVQLSYSDNRGTLLPGFIGEPGFFGKGSGGPTVGFLFGSQADIRMKSLQNNWLTPSENLLDAYQKTKGDEFSYSVSMQPLPDLQLDILAQKEYQNTSLQYGFNLTNLQKEPFVQQLGSFGTTSINMSSFGDPLKQFSELKANALSIANAKAGTTGSTFPTGYGITNSEVLMQALLQTYANKDRTNPIVNIPLPNWNLTYSGLKNNRYLNRYFSRIDLTHAYRSTYNVSGIQSNLTYYEQGKVLDLNGNYNNPTSYNDITFIESFAPLVGVDMTMRNSLQMRLMYNRDRIQSFSFINSSLTDQQTNELQFGIGYIFKDMRMNIRYRGAKKTIKGDLNIKGDFIVRDTETSILRLIEDDAQITAGDKQISFKSSAEYNITQYFSLMFFYNHLITDYKISTAYPITDIRAGLTAKFSFGK